MVEENKSIFKDVLDHLPFANELDLDTSDSFYNPVRNFVESALAVLRQNGVGVEHNIDGYVSDLDWNEWFSHTPLDSEKEFNQNDAKAIAINSSKQYVYLYTQIYFDPPQSSSMSILEKSLEEYLWRARWEVDRL